MKSSKTVDEFLHQSPQNYDGWLLKGNSLYYRGKYPEAFDAYNKTLDNPQNYLARKSMVYSNIGTIYIQLDQYQKAIEACDKAIRMEPNSPVFINGGIAQFGLGMPDEALQLFNKVIELKSGDISLAYYNQAVVYYALGRSEDAQKAYEIAGSRNVEFGPPALLSERLR